MRGSTSEGDTSGVPPMPRDAPPAPELTMPPDTSKLKKHLGLLLDKIAKGARLSLDAPMPEMRVAGVYTWSVRVVMDVVQVGCVHLVLCMISLGSFVGLW